MKSKTCNAEKPQQAITNNISSSQPYTKLDFATLKGPNDYAVAAASTETLELVEECMRIWIKQIQQVCHIRAQLDIDWCLFIC